MDTEIDKSGMRATAILATVMAGLWLAALTWLAPVPDPLWLSAVLFAALVAISWFDFDHYRIPNWLSVPLIAGGIAMTYIWHPNNLAFSGLGAVTGYGLVWALAVFWKRARGQDGIGMGDAKLLGASGAWLGVLGLPFVTLIASGAALAAIFTVAVVQRDKVSGKQRVAFGPYIALGFWCIWLARDALGLVTAFGAGV